MLAALVNIISCCVRLCTFLRTSPSAALKLWQSHQEGRKDVIIPNISEAQKANFVARSSSKCQDQDWSPMCGGLISISVSGTSPSLQVLWYQLDGNGMKTFRTNLANKSFCSKKAQLIQSKRALITDMF